MSSAPADIPLIILRLSWSGVKGNLNQWSRVAARWSAFEAADASQHGGDLPLRTSRPPAKKFVVFRFRANALPSWASFLFPDAVGIAKKKAEEADRFYGTLGSQQGGSE